MPKIALKLITLLVCLTLLSSSFPAEKVEAVIASCSASVDLTQVSPGSTNTFTFNVTNGDVNTILWMRFTKPSTNFTLGSAVAPGWTINPTADAITLTK